MCKWNDIGKLFQSLQQIKSTGQENTWNTAGYEVAIKLSDEYIGAIIIFLLSKICIKKKLEKEAHFKKLIIFGNL